MNLKLSEQLELLFGSIGVILGIFFSIFLFISYKKQPKASFFLAIYLLTFSLRIGKSVFHYFYDIQPGIRNFFIATLFCVGPSLWLYTKYLITPNSVKNYKDILHYIPFFLIVPFCSFIPNNGPEGLYAYIFKTFYNATILHMFIYCIMSIVWFFKNKIKETITESKRKTSWLKYFLAINLLLVIFYFLISELIFAFYIGLSFLFSFIIIFFSVWALKNPFLFQVPKEKYSNSSLNKERSQMIIKNLKEYLEKEKPFLNPSLTLSTLSKNIGISTKELSQVINQSEKLNYSQFISKYRVEEAKQLLTAPSHKDLTIAAIAYDAGFNSISSFNTIFKKITNTTPIEYQKTQRKI